MYTLEGTVLIQSSRNIIRMLMIIIPRSSSTLGHVGSKTRSLGQILEKPCVHSRGTVLIQSSRNIIRMLMIIIPWSSSTLGYVGSKTRSLGQILEKPFVHSKVHSFVLNVMKLCQNVYHHNI